MTIYELTIRIPSYYRKIFHFKNKADAAAKKEKLVEFMKEFDLEMLETEIKEIWVIE